MPTPKVKNFLLFFKIILVVASSKKRQNEANFLYHIVNQKPASGKSWQERDARFFSNIDLNLPIQGWGPISLLTNTLWELPTHRVGGNAIPHLLNAVPSWIFLSSTSTITWEGVVPAMADNTLIFYVLHLTGRGRRLGCRSPAFTCLPEPVLTWRFRSQVCFFFCFLLTCCSD